ncbi:hypothetical protein CHS0354_011285 [Potamilus streckersoni]|uniref:Ima1 N-terminal domain-containing protein n=1 Tax=Potamilus streckersoni TaxID=2493646 RepID=A0AAE0S8P9_9BIVA|nr:hypothetical protein CHS0354_011285 [Potamilus streckersoni]
MSLLSGVFLISVSLTLLAVFYNVFRRFIRPKFPVHVNCWFCNQDTVVPYGNRNCWDCPHCDQYNGFNETGGYNKPIPAQLHDDLNYPVGCKQDEFISNDDILCKSCNRNQQLKIKQIALFEPMNEANFDAEFAAHKIHLEQVYKLCSSCQEQVDQELQRQDDILRPKVEKLHASLNQSIQWDSEGDHCTSSIERETDKRGGFVHFLAWICSLCLLFISVHHMFWRSEHIPPVVCWLDPILIALDRFTSGIAFFGMILNVGAKFHMGKHRLSVADVISCPVWLIVLLIQTDFLPFSPNFQKMNIELFVCLLNTFIASLCTSQKRQRRNKTTIKISRVLLDSPDRSSTGDATSISPFSSVSQPTRTRSFHSKEMPSSPFTFSLSQSAFKPINPATKLDEPDSSLEDTRTDLETISLGPSTSLKQTDSAVFSSSFSTPGYQSNFIGSTQGTRQQRLLISPAKFTVKSTNQSPFRQEKFNFQGLDKKFAMSEENLYLFQKLSSSAPSPIKSSVFGGKKDFQGLSSMNTFPAFKSSTPSIMVKNSGSTFTMPQTKFSVWSGRNCSQFDEDEEEEIERLTRRSPSRISSYCPVDSTTKSEESCQSKGKFLMQPAFLIGVVMGASVVMNVLLVVYLVVS